LRCAIGSQPADPPHHHRKEPELSKRKQKPAPAAPAPIPPAPAAPALPEFTLQTMIAQRDALKQQREQAIANLNAISGALNFCEAMVEQMTKAEAEKAKAPAA